MKNFMFFLLHKNIPSETAPAMVGSEGISDTKLTDSRHSVPYPIYFSNRSIIAAASALVA